jgi:type III secretory pathway lipoprotein EscJ
MLNFSSSSYLTKAGDRLEAGIGMKALRQTVTIALLVCATACGTSPVADELSQREANQIVSALQSKGVDSSTEKERGSKGRYSVVVSSSDFGKAASLLSELGLPAERKASFSELVSSSGFLPSSREVEALRLDRALAAELEDLVLGHPEIATAHIVVRSHSVGAQAAASSIAVVAQKKASAAVEPAAIREIVSRSVPGIRTEDIVVSLSEQSVVGVSSPVVARVADALVPFLVFWRVPSSEYNSLAGLVVALLAFVGGLAGVGGYIFGQYTLSKQHGVVSTERLYAAAPVSHLSAPRPDSQEDGEGET